MRTLVALLLTGSFALGSGCGQSGTDQAGSGGEPSTGGQPSTGAAPSDEGSGGDDSGGTGGFATGGGAADWPEWVDGCIQLRQQSCAPCSYPECVVCVYGTDEELASTGVVCDDSEENYEAYCACEDLGGCPACREEWR